MTPLILEDIKNLIPPPSSTEYEQLEDSISQDGLLHPVQTGMVPELGIFVLDGHNRKAICEKLGVDCRYTDPINFESLEQAKLWAINQQLGRRNICDFARGELVLKRKGVVKEEALKRKSTGGSQHTKHSAGASGVGETRKLLAEQAGISHNTLHKIETLTRDADPETLQALRSKGISINKAYNSLMPKEQEDKAGTKGLSIVSRIQKLVDQFFDIGVPPSNDDLKSIEKIIHDLQSVVDTALAS